MSSGFSLGDLSGNLPILTLILFGLGAMLFEVFARPGMSRAFIGTLTAVGFGLALAVNHSQWSGGPWSAGETVLSTPMFGGMLVRDAFGAFFNMIFFTSGLLTALLSTRYLSEHGIDHGEYYALLLFGAVGMSLMAAARDLIVLFIALEVMSVAVYVLTTFRRRSRASAEAGLKYFMLGAFASAFLLYGVALIYGATGSTQGTVIRDVLEADSVLAGSKLVRLGLIALVVGLGFKIALAPFHLWAPDVYQGAPAPITAFMAVGVKAAGFAALIRLLMITFGVPAIEFGSDGYGSIGLIYCLAIITMIAGNFGALAQTNIKRMLAYASIAHAGYLMVGVVAACTTGGGEEATSAVLYYLLAYTFSIFLVFGVLVMFGQRGEEFAHLSDFAGMGFRKLFLGFALTLGLLSLAGLPPLGGFFGKFYLLREAVAPATPAMLTLALVVIVNSMIGVYYYARVIVFLYMKEPTREIPVFQSSAAMAVLAISMVLVLLLGVFPDDYLELARRSLLSLGPH